MTAVTASPMTMAVTTSADGIGSTARDGASATAQRAVDNRRRSVRDIADRHDDDMGAGADQREAR